MLARMGLRFRRRIKILPGITLNLSRSGVSTSVGVRGAHVTVGHGQVRETVGIPGSGLSYTHVQSADGHVDDAPAPGPERSLLARILGGIWHLVLLFALVIGGTFAVVLAYATLH